VVPLLDPHLSWTEKDESGLKIILEKWSRNGFEGEVNLGNLAEGYASITTRNWAARAAKHGSFVTMEVHKLRGKKGFFGTKTKWVVRQFSCESYDGVFPVMHGCAEGHNILSALAQAMLDVGYGFMSRSRLEVYFEK